MSPTSYQAAPPRVRGGYLSREVGVVKRSGEANFRAGSSSLLDLGRDLAQEGVHAAEELGREEGLRDELLVVVELAHALALRVAGHEEHLERRIARAQGVRELHAAQAGHDDVADEERD